LTTNRSVLRWVGAGTVLLLGLAWFALLPAPRASALFSQPVSVSPTGYDAYDQRVAVDRQGDAALVWVRKSRAYPYTWRVQFRSRSRTGAWGSTIDLSPSGQAPRSPKVVVDDDGDAVVVWDAYNGTDYHVYTRRVSRTGGLGALKVLTPGGVSIHGTDVAVDPDGDAVVTWAEWHSTGATLPMMRRYSRSGTLSAPVVLASSPARADPPAVALDRQGDAVLAWANDWLVQARTLGASGTLGPLTTVSPDLSPIDRHFVARVTTDRDGDALVTWEHWTAADLTTQIWGRWISRDGVVGAVRQLTPSSHTELSNYSVAGDLEGDVMLTWDLFPSAYLYARRITRTGAIGRPVLLASSGRFHTVRIDDDGDGVVVWQSKGAGNIVADVRARRVTSLGTFGSARVVASNGRYPTTAVGPTGRAVVAWERQFAADLRIQASVGP
jgi:hypothetical protein